ncbi:MAG: seryl-tRNA synthetase, partial [Paenibacillus sp.]|nr:seryl-tRNA synthetase [Paenibacillus sp.]
MLDIKWIREHEQLVQQTADQKGIDISIAALLRQDERRRRLLLEVEQLRQGRNRLTQDIHAFMKANRQDEADQTKQRVTESNARLTVAETELRSVEGECQQLLLRVPNFVSPDTPIGRSDQDNVELKQVGEPPMFGFEPKDHVALG